MFKLFYSLRIQIEAEGNGKIPTACDHEKRGPLFGVVRGVHGESVCQGKQNPKLLTKIFKEEKKYSHCDTGFSASGWHG